MITNLSVAEAMAETVAHMQKMQKLSSQPDTFPAGFREEQLSRQRQGTQQQHYLQEPDRRELTKQSQQANQQPQM